jgi:hypothetical protein
MAAIKMLNSYSTVAVCKKTYAVNETIAPIVYLRI